VLDAAETLLLCGGDKPAVFYQGGGGVAMPGIESEYDHRFKNPCTLPPLVA
jgi:hypothetical protein